MQQAYKIAIVEDEALIAESLEIMLNNDGFDIVGKYYSYEEAIEGLANTDFDLALLDINIGSGKTGIDVAKEVLVPAAKPFIFLTAYNDKQTIANAIATSPSTYLIKPTNSQTLFAAIQLALHNHFETDILKPETNDYIFIKLGKQNIKLTWLEVDYITHEKNYIRLSGANIPTSGYLIRASLQHCLVSLMPKEIAVKFIQINRKTIVRRQCITKFTTTELCINDTFFEVGSTFYADIKLALKQ
jgi:two-component system, LytTR family, response regulator LytT